MNTSFSSSLTIPPRFVRAPPEAQGGDSREAVGPGWPGGGAFQLLRSSREISPSSNTAGERGSVRRSTIRRAGASSGHWAPRVGWRGLGSKGCEPSLRRWGFGKVPCPDEVGQEEGNRPGHPPPPALPAESREMGTHPHLLRSCPLGTRSAGTLREEQCRPRPATMWLCCSPAPWSGQVPEFHVVVSSLSCL